MFWCNNCRTTITLVDQNNVPVYRKAKLIEKHWAVVKYFCSPKCSLDDHETNVSRDPT